MTCRLILGLKGVYYGRKKVMNVMIIAPDYGSVPMQNIAIKLKGEEGHVDVTPIGKVEQFKSLFDQ